MMMRLKTILWFGLWLALAPVPSWSLSTRIPVRQPSSVMVAVAETNQDGQRLHNIATYEPNLNPARRVQQAVVSATTGTHPTMVHGQARENRGSNGDSTASLRYDRYDSLSQPPSTQTAASSSSSSNPNRGIIFESDTSNSKASSDASFDPNVPFGFPQTVSWVSKRVPHSLESLRSSNGQSQQLQNYHALPQVQFRADYPAQAIPPAQSQASPMSTQNVQYVPVRQTYPTSQSEVQQNVRNPPVAYHQQSQSYPVLQNTKFSGNYQQSPVAHLSPAYVPTHLTSQHPIQGSYDKAQITKPEEISQSRSQIKSQQQYTSPAQSPSVQNYVGFQSAHTNDTPNNHESYTTAEKSDQSVTDSTAAQSELPNRDIVSNGQKSKLVTPTQEHEPDSADGSESQSKAKDNDDDDEKDQDQPENDDDSSQEERDDPPPPPPPMKRRRGGRRSNRTSRRKPMTKFHRRYDNSDDESPASDERLHYRHRNRPRHYRDPLPHHRYEEHDEEREPRRSYHRTPKYSGKNTRKHTNKIEHPVYSKESSTENRYEPSDVVPSTETRTDNGGNHKNKKGTSSTKAGYEASQDVEDNRRPSRKGDNRKRIQEEDSRESQDGPHDHDDRPVYKKPRRYDYRPIKPQRPGYRGGGRRLREYDRRPGYPDYFMNSEEEDDSRQVGYEDNYEPIYVPREHAYHALGDYEDPPIGRYSSYDPREAAGIVDREDRPGRGEKKEEARYYEETNDDGGEDDRDQSDDDVEDDDEEPEEEHEEEPPRKADDNNNKEEAEEEQEEERSGSERPDKDDSSSTKSNENKMSHGEGHPQSAQTSNTDSGAESHQPESANQNVMMPQNHHSVSVTDTSMQAQQNAQPQGDSSSTSQITPGPTLNDQTTNGYSEGGGISNNPPANNPNPPAGGVKQYYYEYQTPFISAYYYDPQRTRPENQAATEKKAFNQPKPTVLTSNARYQNIVSSPSLKNYQEQVAYDQTEAQMTKPGSNIPSGTNPSLSVPTATHRTSTAVVSSPVEPQQNVRLPHSNFHQPQVNAPTNPGAGFGSRVIYVNEAPSAVHHSRQQVAHARSKRADHPLILDQKYSVSSKNPSDIKIFRAVRLDKDSNETILVDARITLKNRKDDRGLSSLDYLKNIELTTTLTKPRKDSKVPACATTALFETICVEDKEYPSGEVEKVFSNSSIFQPAAAESKDRTATKNHVKKAGTCRSITTTLTPLRAKSANGQWKVIVNNGNFRQILQADICISTGRCRFIAAAAFTSECRQNRSLRPLLTFNPEDGELSWDSFSVPDGCTCHVARRP